MPRTPVHRYRQFTHTTGSRSVCSIPRAPPRGRAASLFHLPSPESYIPIHATTIHNLATRAHERTELAPRHLVFAHREGFREIVTRWRGPSSFWRFSSSMGGAHQERTRRNHHHLGTLRAITERAARHQERPLAFRLLFLPRLSRRAFPLGRLTRPAIGLSFFPGLHARARPSSPPHRLAATSASACSLGNFPVSP